MKLRGNSTKDIKPDLWKISKFSSLNDSLIIPPLASTPNRFATNAI